MQKNYRCPGCSATMEFFPSTQKMYCAYCGSMYSVEELNALQGESKEEEQAGFWPGTEYGYSTEEDSSTDAEQISAVTERSGRGELLDDSWLYGGAGSGSVAGGNEQFREEDLDPATSARRQKEMERRHATIQMKILHCNACGAELAMNGVESSSFCAYCGQATVVMDRVEDYLQPDYIMPFRITREQAESIIRKRISEGEFIPEEIKHFEVEKLRGIYIPFWLFDMYYGDDQFWKYTVKRGKHSVTRYSHRIGDCFFKKMTLDASRNFNDDSSQRLEPYDMAGLLEFDAAYLSGFYSDRFDVGTDDLEDLAYRRAKELFDENVQKTIHHAGARLVQSLPVHEVTKRDYALLPVWFLTFRYENMPYTILVNGQTGKMVGAVPYIKRKAALRFTLLAVVFCAVFAVIGGYLTPWFFEAEDQGKAWITYFMIVLAAISSTWSIAITKYQEMLKSIGLTRSGTTSRFVRERQDRT